MVMASIEKKLPDVFVQLITYALDAQAPGCVLVLVADRR